MAAKNISRKTKKKNRQLPKSAPRRHREHKLIWILVFLALIVTAAIILINLFKPIDFVDKPEDVNKSDDTTSEDIKSEKVKGTTSVKNPSDKPEDDETETEATSSTASDGTPLTNEGGNPNSSATLTGAITYSDVSEGTLLIRTNIDQYLTSGTCDLKMVSTTIPGVSYTATVGLVPSVSSSTCDGFDYPVAELRSGNYTITIDLKSGEKTGTLTGSVSL